MFALLLLLAVRALAAIDDCAEALRSSTLAQTALFAFVDRVEQSLLPAVQFAVNNRAFRFFAAESSKLGVLFDMQLSTLPVRKAVSSFLSSSVSSTNSTSTLTRKGLRACERRAKKKKKTTHC